MDYSLEHQSYIEPPVRVSSVQAPLTITVTVATSLEWLKVTPTNQVIANTATNRGVCNQHGILLSVQPYNPLTLCSTTLVGEPALNHPLETIPNGDDVNK